MGVNHRWITACLTVALCLASVGCETRVVGVRNSYVDTAPATRHAYDPVAQPKRGFLDEVGEFLFGWTRHLSSGGKPQSQPTVTTTQVRDATVTGGS